MRGVLVLVGGGGRERSLVCSALRCWRVRTVGTCVGYGNQTSTVCGPSLARYLCCQCLQVSKNACGKAGEFC